MASFLSIAPTQDRSTKELVILLLGSIFPLTTTEIREQLRVRYRRRISFQAAAKAVRQLIEEGVVECHERQHRLSIKWLGQTRKFVNEVSARYNNQTMRPDFVSSTASGAISVFKATSLYATDTLWTELLLEAIKNEEEQYPSVRYLSIGSTPWWLPLSVGRETGLFIDLLERNVAVRMLLSSRSVLSKWAGEIYGDVGIKVRYFKDDRLPLSTAYNILNEHVIQIECSPKLVAPFARVKTPFGTKDSKRLHELGHARGECQITFSKNKILADALWSQLHREASFTAKPATQ